MFYYMLSECLAFASQIQGRDDVVIVLVLSF